MDTSISVLFLFIICVSNTCVWSMTWTTSTNAIPELWDKGSAFIAYYNETVQIFGGWDDHDIMTFSLDFSSISNTSHTTTAIEFGYQYAQSSTQIKHKLWMLLQHSNSLEYSNTLSVFDLNKQTITQTIVYPGVSSFGKCVTNYYNKYILVLGGIGWYHGYQKDFNIYNISNNSWSVGTELKYNKSGHSCNVVNSE
eukprot:309619_1